MKKITLLLIMLFVSGLAFAQPANDLCVNAITIAADGTIPGDTTGGTLDGLPFCGTGETSPSVWYTFTDGSGTGSAVSVNTCSAVGYDTKISVYSGSCGALACVGGNDDMPCGFSNLRSQVDFVTDGSSTYYVVVHGFGGQSGPFELNVSGLPISVVGNPPVMNCPADLMIDTSMGLCTGVGNWADPVAFDIEDGFLTPTQTMGMPSGTPLPPGVHVIEYSVTDSDMNTVTCQFTVTVTDNEAPVAVCQNIALDLDATGNISITPADIDGGSTDNCGITSSTLMAQGTATTTLPVSFAGGNGQSGNMFDVMAVNDLTIDSFDISIDDDGSPDDVEIYFKTGTWIGSETTPGDWTLVATVPGVVSGGQNLPTPLNLDLGIDVGAGTTVAFYVTLSTSTDINYTNGTTVGNVWASDANLELYEGAGKTYPFGSTFQPRNFNGNVIYSITGLVPFSGDFDCTHVGDNDITLTVTDDQGNSDSCVAVVTISDNTAPDIVCIGQPANITDSSMASPNLPVSNTLPPTESIITIADDFVITDLDVDLDISHTWVGDLFVTLTSPGGTTVVLIDQMGVPASGFGCMENDLLITLDDEATLPIEDECQLGSPAASGSFTPEEALSAFDGESTLGDWTLSVADLVGGDDGNFNAWGLSYGHDVSGTPLSVNLDANGMATVNAADLLLSIDEGCGYTVTVPGIPPANSLTTTFAAGNGQAGNMFDIMALNDLTINSFDVSIDDGVTDDVEVYFKTGTWVGFDADPGAWTLLDTAAGITSAGDNVPTPLNLNLGVDVTAGSTVAFYVTLTTTTAINYTNGTTTGALFASDANMEFYEGAGNAYPFAATFMPRIFNGNIVYSSGSGVSTTLELDCSNLGSNLVEVTVTDDSGNVSTCMATVDVFDVTPPVLVCADVTLELGPDGTLTVDPMALLATMPGTFEVITISSDNGSGTEGFTDFTVNVTDPASITFDWDYSTPDGAAFDGFGYLLNGAFTELTDPAGGVNQSGSAGPIAVVAGDVFGFRSQSDDGVFGAATTVVSNFMPGFTGQFDPANWTLTLTNSDGDAFFMEIPGGPLSFDACGIDTMGVSLTEVTCADIGAPIAITVFAADASGNPASCVAMVTVVDALPPVVTCPADMTVDPGAGSLFFEVPDYFALGMGTAVDNCTDPVTITSQDPAVGTLIPDGTYTVTLTAEDEYGNVATCTFVLTVESVLGLEDNELANAIAMYPNPAQEQITISNSSIIQLERAAIYDMNGKLVSQTDLSSMQAERTIDVSHLASGVYVVQLTSDKSSAVKRLIKE